MPVRLLTSAKTLGLQAMTGPAAPMELPSLLSSKLALHSLLTFRIAIMFSMPGV